MLEKAISRFEETLNSNKGVLMEVALGLILTVVVIDLVLSAFGYNSGLFATFRNNILPLILIIGLLFLAIRLVGGGGI